MPVVRCPLCIERVSGENIGDLSENVRVHFVDVHCIELPEESMEERSTGRESELELREVPPEPKMGDIRNPTPGGGVGRGVAVDEKEASFTVGDTRTMAGMGNERGVENVVRESGSETSRGISMEGQSEMRERPRPAAEDVLSRSGQQPASSEMKETVQPGAVQRRTARGPRGGLEVDEKEQSFEVGDMRTQSGMGGEWVQGKLVSSSSSESSRGITPGGGNPVERRPRPTPGGNVTEEAVECPMCRERVTGSSEEDLSERFRQHLIINHKDQPVISQIMEDMKRRA